MYTLTTETLCIISLVHLHQYWLYYVQTVESVRRYVKVAKLLLPQQNGAADAMVFHSMLKVKGINAITLASICVGVHVGVCMCIYLCVTLYSL